MSIRFGTDGWRAIISDEFTFRNVRVVAGAIADYFAESGAQDKGVVVGFDTRFLSGNYAREIADVLASHGIPVYLSSTAAPTPAKSLATRELGTAGGVMVTASHNPPEYNGIKIKGPYGGSATPDVVAEIERLLAARLQSSASDGALAPCPNLSSQITEFDPKPRYFESLRSLVDVDTITRSGIHVVVDSMHGAGSGYLSQFFGEHSDVVTEIRDSVNPSFGGVNPEPIMANLAALRDAVLETSAMAGFATDGDADRVGAIDDTGSYVDSHRVFALLLRHLVTNRGLQGKVVKTFSTTKMIDILAGKYRLSLEETPIGFKYVCNLMLRDDVLMGGEESGGFGIKGHIPERDGILCTLLLMEILALSGQSLSSLVRGLMHEVGEHHYGRVDHHISRDKVTSTMRRLTAVPPTNLAGQAVVRVETLDGLKFSMADGSWLLFRPSGTEPLLRVYAEAPSPTQVEDLLNCVSL